MEIAINNIGFITRPIISSGEFRRIFRGNKKWSLPGIDELKIKVGGLNNTEIARVEKTKFWASSIESRLSWKPHIHEVENEIAKKNIGIIHRSRLNFLFPRNILRNLYCSLVLPYLSVLHSCLGHYFCVY